MAKNYEEQLKTWLEETARWGRNKWLWQQGEDHVRVFLYTEGHCYSIYATPDYLGCGASTRKPRPGEDWTRGNDLTDGRFRLSTWQEILKDIVGYELLSISDYILHPPKEKLANMET